MPNYNNEKYIADAIRSILNQTYKNIELIILDDCSTDNSWNIINKFSKKDKRIKIHKNLKRLGVAKTRNKLLKLVSKDFSYIAFMDSDDISVKNRLEIQYLFLERNKLYSGVGSAIEYVNSNLNHIFNRVYFTDFNKIKRKLLISSQFAQATMMFNKEISKYIIYNEKLETSEDYELWFRLINQGFKLINIKNNLYKYRQSEFQLKYLKLKKTLIISILIQYKYLFNKKFFSVFAFINIILELSLLILPNKIILYLFYKSRK